MCSPSKHAAIHDRVAAGGGHGEDVEAEEGEVVVWPAVQGELNVLQQVDEVEGQPADDEHQQHGQQHSVPGPESSRAQHRIIEVSQIFVGSVLAMEMSVKYLKVTISFTKKSVKFSSVFILPQECQLFLGFRQYERKIVKFTARLAWTTIFNKIRQVFSFRSCHLPRLCSSQGQISYKKALEP